MLGSLPQTVGFVLPKFMDRIVMTSLFEQVRLSDWFSQMNLLSKNLKVIIKKIFLSNNPFTNISFLFFLHLILINFYFIF